MSKYPMYEGYETCERCHKPVDKDAAVWFELNSSTGEWLTPGAVPENDSQGCFAFGVDCAKAVRAAPDSWKRIGLAKRNEG